MPALIGPQTQAYLLNAMQRGADLRSRRKLPRWAWLAGAQADVPTGDIPAAGGGQEGPDGEGLTCYIDIVVSMSYDAATHKFQYVDRRFYFSAGRLVRIDAPVTHDVFTAVQESY